MVLGKLQSSICAVLRLFEPLRIKPNTIFCVNKTGVGFHGRYGKRSFNKVMASPGVNTTSTTVHFVITSTLGNTAGSKRLRVESFDINLFISVAMEPAEREKWSTDVITEVAFWGDRKSDHTILSKTSQG